MPEPTAAVPSNALSGIQSLPLRQRLRRVAPYFWGNLRWTWAGALLATLVGCGHGAIDSRAAQTLAGQWVYPG